MRAVLYLIVICLILALLWMFPFFIVLVDTTISELKYEYEKRKDRKKREKTSKTN